MAYKTASSKANPTAIWTAPKKVLTTLSSKDLSTGIPKGFPMAHQMVRWMAVSKADEKGSRKESGMVLPRAH